MYLIHIYVLFAFHMHLKEAWYLDKYLIVSETFMARDSNQWWMLPNNHTHNVFHVESFKEFIVVELVKVLATH